MTERKQENGGIAQLARALGSYPGCHWFESDYRYHQNRIPRCAVFLLGPLVKRLRHRPFTAESWVQFPYGSPSHIPENDVFTLFSGFLFALILLLSFTCPLYCFGLSFVRVVLLEVKHRCDSISCSRLSLIEHMTVDRSRSCYRRVT